MPRLLDLFCGAGGAAAGYHRAGFDVVGVDINPQPNYPFEFCQDDAMDVLADFAQAYPDPGWQQFDAIHALPPCQAYTNLTKINSLKDRYYADLLSPTRDLLDATGLPYVIESVPGSPIRGTLMLCGSSFGLATSSGYYLRRHRYFESNWDLGCLVPPCDHRGRNAILVAGNTSMTTTKPNGDVRSYGGNDRERAEAMGIDWMNRQELAEAIPPVYTEFIGHQLLRHVQRAAEAQTPAARTNP